MRTRHAFRPVLLLPALLLAACNAPADSDPAKEAVSIEWLRANAVPFSTTVPGGSDDDLQRLGEMIGDARIVGLGEATHGSREFFDMKHRVLRYLVRERGVRVFAMEAGWTESLRVNQYLQTGEGNPQVHLVNLNYWTWYTQEVLDMIRWMREYNTSVPEDQRVSFYGFDIQNSISPLNDVQAYVDRVDVAAADSVRAYYECYRHFGVTSQYLAAADTTRARCREGLRAAHALLERQRAAFTPVLGRTAYEIALRTARAAVQNEGWRVATDAVATRDAYMAENVEWLADETGPQTRMVLWAHNGHVARSEPYMGTHLARRFGDDYRVVGFTFHHGSTNAIQPGNGLQAYVMEPAIETSYEYNFERLGHARFYVDLRPVRAAGAPAGTEWLRGPRPMHMLGSTYDPGVLDTYYGEQRLAEEYDVIIHISEITPSRRLSYNIK